MLKRTLSVDSNSDQITWRQDYMERKPNLSPYQIKLLKDGPKSLSEAWGLGAMKRDWNKYFNR